MQTKIKREKLIKIGGFFTGFTKWKKKKTAEEMNNRQGKRKEKEVGECQRREAVSASDRRLSSGFAGGVVLFFFLIWRLHRSRESVGCCCSGVVAGRRWQTGQNMAFFSHWLKKCNIRVAGYGGRTPSAGGHSPPPSHQRATTNAACIKEGVQTVTVVHFQTADEEVETKDLSFYCFPLTKQ